MKRFLSLDIACIGLIDSHHLLDLIFQNLILHIYTIVNILDHRVYPWFLLVCVWFLLLQLCIVDINFLLRFEQGIVLDLIRFEHFFEFFFEFLEFVFKLFYLGLFWLETFSHLSCPKAEYMFCLLQIVHLEFVFMYLLRILLQLPSILFNLNIPLIDFLSVLLKPGFQLLDLLYMLDFHCLEIDHFFFDNIMLLIKLSEILFMRQPLNI